MADPLGPTPSTSVSRIIALIRRLRSDNGCPWDRKQTPDSTARYLIEEVYELVDAIISGNADAVCEEAGDLLFQLLFVVQLYGETGHFFLDDVVARNVDKMVRRHPHVFADARADSVETVRQNWETIKRQERKDGESYSVLDSIPAHIPALLRASMVSERAARTGFDWDDITGVMAKTAEELAEFSTEVKPSAGQPDNEKASLEFGDLLFTLVNVARFAGIHPETALMRSVQKFEKRFGYLERQATAMGRALDSLSFEEMHDLWDEAKDRLG